jgi:uncharacterized protein YjbI with pentapeptide repeats
MSEQSNETNDGGSSIKQEKISPEAAALSARQAKLEASYEANLSAGRAPYAGVMITSRQEVDWIIRKRGWNAYDPKSRAEQANFQDSVLSGDMREVQLSFANLTGAYLSGANFRGAELANTSLREAFVGNANFEDAILVAADLSYAQCLANFRNAQLAGANLSGAILAGDFRGANMIGARLDAGTLVGGYSEFIQGDIQLDSSTQLLDVAWRDAILARIDWSQIQRLGDEANIKLALNRKGRVVAYDNAARAYRGLAKALEAQGLTAPALRYRTRQHELERGALVRDFKFGQWIFSGLLNIVSGYGDKPGRALVVYLSVVAIFAGIFLGVTNPASPLFFSGSQHLEWYEAIVLSLSSFHGRGFFPSGISLGDPVAVVAAIEAVVGLFIELVLIATFTQRFFAR